MGSHGNKCQFCKRLERESLRTGAEIAGISFCLPVSPQRKRSNPWFRKHSAGWYRQAIVRCLMEIFTNPLGVVNISPMKYVWWQNALDPASSICRGIVRPIIAREELEAHTRWPDWALCMLLLSHTFSFPFQKQELLIDRLTAFSTECFSGHFSCILSLSVGIPQGAVASSSKAEQNGKK